MGSPPDTLSKARTCVTCADGHVQPMPNQTLCLRCETDGSVNCDDKTELRARRGFYMPDDYDYTALTSRSLRAFQCPMASGCLGGTGLNGSCAAGYEGPLCGACTVGFAKGAHMCRPCSDTAVKATLKAAATLSVVGIFFGAFLTGKALGGSQRRRFPALISFCSRVFCSHTGQRVNTLVKIMIGWFQALVVVTLFPQLELPEGLHKALRSIQNTLALVNVDIFALAPLECLFPHARITFATKLAATMILPLVIAQGLLLFGAVSSLVTKETLRAALSSRRLFQLSFWCVLLVYILHATYYLLFTTDY